MERYWKAHPAASTSDVVQPNDVSILSKFDYHHLTLLSSQDEDGGWQSEMHQYLKDLPADVMKDTDIVKWWQVHVRSLIGTTNTDW